VPPAAVLQPKRAAPLTNGRGPRTVERQRRSRRTTFIATLKSSLLASAIRNRMKAACSAPDKTAV